MKLIAGPHILKIQVTDLYQLYMISDMHLNHENIIKYTRRPFTDVIEMNNTIIDNINNTISSDDILINCGDFILGKSSEYDEYMNKIHAKKIYNCIGNHDMKNIFMKKPLEPFDEKERVFWSYNILVAVYDKSKHVFSFTCSHCPIPDNQFLGIFNIHGHLHTFENIDDYEGSDKPLAISLLNNGLYYDCGVDKNNFTPISFFDIVKKSRVILNKILKWYPNFSKFIL